MRKVINGKVYDTEKATLVAFDRFGFPGDFNAWYEALYVTRKGNYFLYGEGGPKTRYGRMVSTNTCGGGSDITPLTPEEAFEWLEKHNVDVDVVRQYFSEKLEEA